MAIETSAYYRILEQNKIPGYRTKVPLGVIVINDFEDEINDVYTAMIYLPMVREDAFTLHSGAHREERAALQDLGEKISQFYIALCSDPQLSQDQKLFKSYLDSVLTRFP